MQFNETKAIYLQLVDYFLDQILKKKFKPQDRVPSVRSLAAQAQVTPNTVNRSYQILQDKGLIYNKRGIGYFLSPDAYEIALQIKKQQFMQEVIPVLAKEMQLLGISFQDLEKMFNQYLQNSKNKEQ